MAVNFERTLTESEFHRALLDPNEERLARELEGDSDFAVDGLEHTLLGRLLNLLTGRR